MEIEFFDHFPLWTIVLAFGAIFLSGQEILSVLFTYIYQKIIYPKFKKPGYDPSYLPHCSIIIATKGISKGFEKNFQAFLDQDYPDYEVIFSVEDEADEGLPIIRSLVQTRSNARWVIAGYAKSCSQTNHNLLKAISVVNDSSVFVIADNDICPKASWLRSLVLPLSDKKISATTGYRWLCGTSGNFGEQVHTLMNMTMYSHMYLCSYLFGDIVWGGTMAIRKDVFEELHVARCWAETVSDDLSLTKILAENRKRSIFVPECLSLSNDVIDSTEEIIGWFTRQLLLLKAFFFVWWMALGGFASVGAVILYALLPVALIGSIFTEKTFWDLGGLPALIFYAGEYLAAWLFGILGPTRRHWLFIIRMPFLRFPQMIGYFKSIGTYQFTWAKIIYKFNRRGQVQQIIR